MATSGKNSVVLKISGDNKEAQRVIAETIRTVEKMGGSINTQSAAAVKAFRAEADAARELLRQVGASERQFESLARTTQRVETAAASHMLRIGGAARTMATGLDNIARSGNLAGEGMRTVMSAGSELAFMFGPAGAIVGAVAITGGAIYNLFERTRKEMEATRKKFEDEIAGMVRAANQLGMITKLRDLELGDPGLGASPYAPGAYVGGTRDLEGKLAQRRATSGAGAAFGAAGGGIVGGLIGRLFGRAVGAVLTDAEVDRIESQLRELRRQREELEKKILNPIGLPRPITGLPAVTVNGSPASVSTSATGETDLNVRISLPTSPVSADQTIPGSAPVNPGAVKPLGDELENPWHKLGNSIENATKAQEHFEAGLVHLTQVAVGGFAEASVNAFLLWAEGGKVTGKQFGESVLSGIEAAAAGKAVFYLAEGIAAIGQSFIPGGQASAVGAGFYFKSAAMMAAIAGGAAALGGNAAGGRNASPGGGTAQRQASFNEMERGTATITIIGGNLLDTTDTRAMDQLAEAIRSLTNRHVIIQHA